MREDRGRRTRESDDNTVKYPFRVNANPLFPKIWSVRHLGSIPVEVLCDGVGAHRCGQCGPSSHNGDERDEDGYDAEAPEEPPLGGGRLE